MEKMKEFVEVNNLDCVAITNHNYFAKDQFIDIQTNINTCMFLPGIEIDIENGHMLVIASNGDLEVFSNQCLKTHELISDEKEYINLEEFKTIFANYNDYLLIFHYDKRPKVKIDVITQLSSNLILGEVSSAVKWQYYNRHDTSFTPLLFSDIRIMVDIDPNRPQDMFSTRNMYIDLTEIDISSLKTVFADSTKYHINSSMVNDYFEVGEGVLASTGLNVVFGQRSSGKTYLLDRIAKKDWENVKYIEQFELSSSSEDGEFDKKINTLYDRLRMTYLSELQSITKRVLSINYEEYNQKLMRYNSSLSDYAKNYVRNNTFARTKIFTAVDIPKYEMTEIDKVISSVEVLLNTTNEYKTILFQSFTENDLIESRKRLLEHKFLKVKSNLIKEYSNTTIKAIQDALGDESNIGTIERFDIIEYSKDIYRIMKFEELIIDVRKIESTSVAIDCGFEIIRNRREITSAKRLGEIHPRRLKYATPYKKYSEPYIYLQLLKTIGVEDSSIHKLLVDVSFSAKNADGNNLSGGERSEFILTNELKYNELFDVILLDEPESSFDNMFLNNHITELLLELSKKSTVFVTTHNPNLGVLKQANNIIYTENDKGVYSKYFGSFNSNELKNEDKTIELYASLMNMMEAGKKVYEERGKLYEDIRNK
jgi:hypothetical protein